MPAVRNPLIHSRTSSSQDSRTLLDLEKHIQTAALVTGWSFLVLAVPGICGMLGWAQSALNCSLSVDKKGKFLSATFYDRGNAEPWNLNDLSKVIWTASLSWYFMKDSSRVVWPAASDNPCLHDCSCTSGNGAHAGHMLFLCSVSERLESVTVNGKWPVGSAPSTCSSQEIYLLVPANYSRTPSWNTWAGFLWVGTLMRFFFHKVSDMMWS